jgi:MazG family protein
MATHPNLLKVEAGVNDHYPQLSRLIAVIAQLRDPVSGCPWDLKQTHQTLRPYMLEEAYEAVLAFDSGNTAAISEELGDVLLQVVLHAQLAKDANTFTLETVAQGIADKLIHRHPHVFGDTILDSGADSAEQVTANWQQIKAAEKAAQGQTQPASIMDDVPNGIPALMQALAVSKKAVSQGFDWPDFDSLWTCMQSELVEFKAEHDTNAPLERLEDELGDMLFATVNVARYHKVDPEVALLKATQKFMTRYRTMETLTDKPLNEQPFEVLDDLWNRAKQQVTQV